MQTGSISFWAAGSIVCFALATAAGCSSDGLTTIPVEGTVTLDNQPVAGAGVLFMPVNDGPPGAGTTDEQGRFTIRTADQAGAIAGEHQVTVTLQKTTGVGVDASGLDTGESPGGIKIEWIVPEKYSRPGTSGLTARVAPDSTKFTFELKSN